MDHRILSSSVQKEKEDSDAGFQTLAMDVKFIDVVVGRGNVVQDKSLVTVRYKLTGGRYCVQLDSSKNFTLRVGAGAVIKGWEIGLLGMAVGGTRKLIIPPKAGYGSQDIGAGAGALLFFDVTLLTCA